MAPVIRGGNVVRPPSEVLLGIPVLLLLLALFLSPLPLLGLALLGQLPDLVAALLQDRHEVVDDGVLRSGRLQF